MKCPWAIFHQPSNIYVRMPYALSSGLITTYSIIYEVLNELNVTNTNYTSLSFYQTASESYFVNLFISRIIIWL